MGRFNFVDRGDETHCPSFILSCGDCFSIKKRKGPMGVVEGFPGY
jgi:hypothetical protein